MKHCLPISLLVISFATAVADTLFLNDGTQLKGRIIEETPDGVTVEYFATSTIKDQKTIVRSDIARIEKVARDQVAYQDLGPLTTPPLVLDTSFYDELTARKIPDFIAKYPYSSHLEELRGRLKTLTEERERVIRGDRRIDSVWITAESIAEDPYQNGARIAFAKMGAPLVCAHPVEYLRSYETLEKLYPGSSVMPEAVDRALLQLDKLQAQIAVARANGEITMKNLSNAIVSARADEARQLRDGINRDTAAINAAMKTAAANGTKFFPVYQNSKEALDALQALAVSEKSRLMQLKKTPMREGIAAARAASEALASGNLDKAQEQLAVSQKCWPANIDNIRLKEQIETLATNKTAAAAAQKPE